MKKRFMFLIAAIIMLPAAGLAAQEGSFSFLSFDIGYGPAISFNGGPMGNIQTFGLNIRIAGPLTIGTVFNQSAVTDSMLKIKYEVISLVRIAIGYGQNNRVGIGLEIIPFKRSVSGLYTEFKISPEYTWVSTGNINAGNFVIPIAMSVGF